MNLLLGELAYLKAIGHIVKYIVMGQKGIALEHHGRIPLIGCQGIDSLIPQVDIPLIRALKSRNHAQGSGLAAPGRPQECHEASGLDIQGGILHRIEFLSCLWICIYFGNVFQTNTLFLFLHINFPPCYEHLASVF